MYDVWMLTSNLGSAYFLDQFREANIQIPK